MAAIGAKKKREAHHASSSPCVTVPNAINATGREHVRSQANVFIFDQILWLQFTGCANLERGSGASRVFVGYLSAMTAARPIQQCKKNT